MQKQFSENYGVGSDLELLSPPETTASIEDTLSFHYQQKIIIAMKQDNPQAALAWIDQIDRLANEINQLF
ncbi:hypothetical protein [Endozoicomonas lisbonensis]